MMLITSTACPLPLQMLQRSPQIPHWLLTHWCSYVSRLHLTSSTKGKMFQGQLLLTQSPWQCCRHRALLLGQSSAEKREWLWCVLPAAPTHKWPQQRRAWMGSPSLEHFPASGPASGLENQHPDPSSEDPQESLQRWTRLPGFLGLFAGMGPALKLPAGIRTDKGGPRQPVSGQCWVQVRNWPCSLCGTCATSHARLCLNFPLLPPPLSPVSTPWMLRKSPQLKPPFSCPSALNCAPRVHQPYASPLLLSIWWALSPEALAL